jgi:hypothetical protein
MCLIRGTSTGRVHPRPTAEASPLRACDVVCKVMSRPERQSDEKVTQPRMVSCIECGCLSGLAWAGWRAYRVDDPEYDEPPALAFYCPGCAAAEFGHG